MSSALTYGRAEQARRRRTTPALGGTGAWRLPGLSILAFATLAMLAGLRFAALILHPSFLRVLGIAGLGAALAAGLLASASMPWKGPFQTLARLLMTALALYLAMCCAGLPWRELLPWQWGSLSAQLHHGTKELDGLWPYRGSSHDARVAVMACLPVVVIAAAALVFWPGGWAATRRRMTALLLLLGLYVAAAANEPRGEWQVQGLVLLFALYLWAWSWRSRRAEDGRAAAWLLLGALISVILAGALGGAGPLLDVRSWQPFSEPGATTSFDWNQTYGPLAWSTSTAEMVQVSSRGAHLWRATELDRFNGTAFLASGHALPEQGGLAEDSGNRRWVTTATVTVHDLASRDLLSPGQIIAASAQGVPQSELPSPAPDGTLTATSTLPGATRYTVTAYVPQPTPLEMRRAPMAVPSGEAAYTRFELPGHTGELSTASAEGRALLEASPYKGVYALARRLAAGSRGTYETASRIEAYLRDGRFVYDTEPPPSPYPIVTFLLDNHLGYCQHFSAAMALLLRMDGVPVRVASGFLSGVRTPGGAYDVDGLDAHAWVEVHFDGIGWVPFDPTPPQHITISSSRSSSEPSAGQLAARVRTRVRRSAAVSTRGQRRRSKSSAVDWPLLCALVLAAVLSLALGLLVRRRERLGAAPSTAEDGAAAVEELQRALTLLGLEPAPGTTLAELERSLAQTHGQRAADYIGALRALRYSSGLAARGPSAAERRRLRQALGAGGGLRGWFRALRALPPRLILD